MQHTAGRRGLAETGWRGQVDARRQNIAQRVERQRRFVRGHDLRLALLRAAPQGQANQVFVRVRGEVPQPEDSALHPHPGAARHVEVLLAVSVPGLPGLRSGEIATLRFGERIQLL